MTGGIREKSSDVISQQHAAQELQVITVGNRGDGDDDYSDDGDGKDGDDNGDNDDVDDNINDDDDVGSATRVNFH